METPRDIDSDGLSYQSDDDDYDGTFAPDEPEYTHLQYPDEVLEEACHPWGMSQHAPSNADAKKYAKALVNRPDHIFKANIYEAASKGNSRKYIVRDASFTRSEAAYVYRHVPVAEQRRFRSRKGGIFHNVFAAVTFEGRFVYVLAGAEGSIGDASLIR
ncbi:hypothetical protein E4U23_002240, partial [Claviceps purpurea]